MVSKEEKLLKKRLEGLERKYKGELFSDFKDKLSFEIKKNFEEVENDNKVGERKVGEEKIKRGKIREREIDGLKDYEEDNDEILKNKKVIEQRKEITKVQKKIKNKIKTKSSDTEQKQTAHFSVQSVSDETGFSSVSPHRKSYEDFLGTKIQGIFVNPQHKSEGFGDVLKKPTQLEIKKSAESIDKLRKEISKVLVGQDEIVDGLIRGLLCNAHVLVEGVPGIAKTLAIRALAQASGCDVKRIQFTVDMLPTDIIGITSYTPEKGFEVVKGPVFSNFIIADEINRAPPKTQSALIEAMQEKQVTIGREKYVLPAPFFVMATENPIENAGVYPLPEAQIDRFLFKLIMDYPEEDEEREIMASNITIQKFEDFNLKPVITPKRIAEIQEIVKKVYLDESIKSYILSIVRKTRDRDFDNSEYLSYGSSPRASIGLFIASKARALMEGRDYVLPEDVKKIVYDVLRHRLILSYKATIDKISSDVIIKSILESVRVE